MSALTFALPVFSTGQERPKVREPWMGFSRVQPLGTAVGESAGQTGPSGLFPES